MRNVYLPGFQKIGYTFCMNIADGFIQLYRWIFFLKEKTHPCSMPVVFFYWQDEIIEHHVI